MKKTLLASALILASATASASGFNYSYGEIGYGESYGDGDGIYFGGAYDLQQGFGLIGSLYLLDYDNGRYGDGDFDIFTIGAQFHAPINNKADFVASVQLVNADADCDFGGRDYCDDENGLLLRGGIRFALQQNLQLEGDLSYNTNDYWDGDELGIKAGLRFFVDRQLSLAVGVASDQELDGLYVSGRYDFK